ncbi:AI-2E family transporter [Bradyrhizobium sp. AUGA SZCCT0177]|uniref:AI-2E family transporter n=1 Tax=unclassified Bradyrhizobium TaxID=2631580 RepID=UPI001BAD2285|nr:AI-2E family transporter [Bradyrhizobium sp. AUGA SZCCT0182]MBR1236025.1 AI-2E family transporter [Bradyrhizobium sp. AUGA SZCCT0182]MBR1280702.1 AI-2E family transporter [Bradyrhizobium sp. AUGA SZCCT0177]
MRRIEDQSFLLLLLVVSIAFGWILKPFYGAILWATVAAVIFAPLNRKLLVRTGGKPGIAALVTVLIIIAMVILPLAMIAASLTQEASNLYAKVQSGEYDFARYIQRIFDALPAWATGLLDSFNLNNLPAVRDWLASGAMKGGQVLAPQALSIGMNTFDFMIGLGIMLYLLFFLLRDGKALAERIKRIVPLRADQKTALFGRFADVVRATVKGGILVAIAQGTLGGLAFWFLGIHAPLLWAVLMAFLSLLPAIGSGLVWVPVAIYLLASGAVWQGVALIVYGVLVIGLVDNLLRPFLIGKDAKLPDYVVLISTLGGIEVFGLNGFVIGPVIAAMFMVTWESFSTSRQGNAAGATG